MLSPIYFQFKEDESLKLFSDDRILIPKVLRVYEIRKYTIFDKSTLKRLILEDILMLKHPIADGIPLPQKHAEFENGDELLLGQIISLVNVKKKRFTYI